MDCSEAGFILKLWSTISAANLGTVAKITNESAVTFKSVISDGAIVAASARPVRTTSRSSRSADPSNMIRRDVGVQSAINACTFIQT